MPYIGEVRMFAGNYAPADWVLCDGRALDIASYDTLFFLIGTTYGGDGVNYFNVPDFRGRVPLHAGTATWGTYLLGDRGGTETNTLNTSTMPAHSHPLTGVSVASLSVSTEDGHKTTPGANYPAVNGQNIYSTTTDGSATGSATINLVTASSGQANPQPISNMQPYLAINYIICAFGIYPQQ
jgi:microcystin-dependent protein